MRGYLSFFTLMMLILCFTVSVNANKPDFKPVADVMIGASGITWTPKMNYEQLIVTVKRPDGTVFSKTFSAGSTPYINLSAIYGENPVEGQYSYELVAVARHEPRVRESPETAGIVKELRPDQKPAVQTGYFSVREGMIVTPGIAEPRINKPKDNLGRPMDEVIYDDLIVDGRLCVGSDCHSSVLFGYDTIVLMANNLRIYFDDTDTPQSPYPYNDWRIVCNDGLAGGGSYFALQDVSGGLTPFTIEAGANTNSLYVDDHGRVGLGTSEPVCELHIKSEDTPWVRLHQSTETGWPEQIWDMLCNETSFFIRDSTHAGWPLRIEPGPHDTLCLKADGKVGIGTWSPSGALELQTASDANFIVKRIKGSTATFGAGLGNVYMGAQSNHELDLYVNNSWKMRLNIDESLDMSNGAECDATGHWNDASSREYKENIKNLTVDEAISTLNGLEPIKFNYKKDKTKDYAGFIAEDVPELVATKSRKTLGSLDIIAVLTKVVQEQQEFIREQQKINAQLKKKIAELEKKIGTLPGIK